MKNALVIGGTGMLASLSIRLLESYHVFVVARHHHTLKALQERAGSRDNHLITMALDYREPPRLGHWIAHMQLMHGPLDLVVAWIHGEAQPVADVVMEEVSNYRHTPWDYYQVECRQSLGSGVKDAHITLGCRYHRIVLGYCWDGDHRRWLTHEEISDGVWQGIEEGSALRLVGQTDDDIRHL